MRAAFGHHLTRHNRIVDEDEIIHHRQVQLKQIPYPSGIAAPNNMFFHIVAAVFDAFCNTLQRQFRTL